MNVDLKVTILFSVVLIGCVADITPTRIVEQREISAILDEAIIKFSSSILLPPNPTSFPRSIDNHGEIKLVPTSDWTSGFFPGIYWMMYRHTDNVIFLI